MINKKFLLLFFISVYFVSGCATKDNYSLFQEKKPKQQKEQKVKKPAKKIFYEYKIAPGDRVSVIVFGHEELSTGKLESNIYSTTRQDGVLVSAKGTIVLPLIKEIKVAGLTKTQAKALIEEKLSKYVKNPEVYVEILNQRVYVLGEVNKPGNIPLFDERMTLIEAIARAGDFNIYSLRNRVMIIRGDLNNPEVKYIDLTDLNNIKASDLFLQPNDIVYVPPNKMRKVNVRINEIRPPLQLISEILQPFVQIKYLSQ
jgi:polysaccharide export outer membrane protein